MENINAGMGYNVYRDIQIRTGGEIYIGVVGPVRTGKSTFIKRFMDLLVLPNIMGEHEKMRARDELPQSSGGKTITTTEPKFIPKEAAKLTLGGDVDVKVRLIDCVGYMVKGAAGHMEDDAERMVKTPWHTQEIPFTQAAEIGTKKVIGDHSTIGIVVTTDGSIGELPRENYIDAEERTIAELKQIHKPFLVLLNTQRPFSNEAKDAAAQISEKHNVNVIPVNCEQLGKDDINNIMEQILYEFPISLLEFYTPKWLEILGNDHEVKADLISKVKSLMKDLNTIRDIVGNTVKIDSNYILATKLENINMADGSARFRVDVDDKYYYEMLSELIGDKIENEFKLISTLKEMAKMRKEYVKVLNAVDSARQKGYGVITPYREEIELNKPEVIKHGNKFGVKIKAESPSIHLIRAQIETEIAPIVGTQEQADDLIRYIANENTAENGIWETNIFGKTVEQLVNDGISGKIAMIGDESQIKLQDTMQKIVNDSNGGLVCIII